MKRIPLIEQPTVQRSELPDQSLDQPLDQPLDQYWRCLDELPTNTQCALPVENEFPCFEESTSYPIDKRLLARRAFLKWVSASLAVGATAACGRQHHEPIEQYNYREEYYRGSSIHNYASHLMHDGFATGILIKTDNLRPIKVEGNPRHPASLGATDIFAQAATLDLYDPDRARVPTCQGQLTPTHRFQNALLQWRERYSKTQGSGLCVITGIHSSPTFLEQMALFKEHYPKANWYVHDPLDRSVGYRATTLAFGKAYDTTYDLMQADLIVSFGMDLFNEGPGNLVHARQFSQRHRAPPGTGPLPQLYVLESSPSVTGAKADVRIALNATELQRCIYYLANHIGLPTPAPASSPHPLLPGLAQLLTQYSGRSLLVADVRQPPELQALVLAMNVHLGNVHRTLNFIAPVRGQGDPALSRIASTPTALEDHLQDLAPETLIVLDANVIYQTPDAAALTKWIKHVPESVYSGAYVDETAMACQWHVPARHPFESWSDGRAFDGTVSIQQPVIAPLYDGMTQHEILSLLTHGKSLADYTIVRDHWQRRLGVAGEAFDVQWKQILRQGLQENSRFPAQSVQLQSRWLDHLKLPSSSTPPLELQLVPDPTLHDGRFANNAWLQELPKPLTQLTWENAAFISPSLAQTLAVNNGDHIALTSASHHTTVPVFIQPGQAPTVITLSLGYGRSHAGTLGTGCGINAYPFRKLARWCISDIRVEAVSGHTPLATTQHLHGMGGRDLIRDVTLSQLRMQPPIPENPPPTLYGADSPSATVPADYHWGMSIDLDACTGCAACIIACQAENNIPVTGKEEILRGRDMHWLRVDSYYKGAADAPTIVFQPVPCMHCELAPCEYVCPVIASVHSSEGLNQQVYNRCIGTRDCSQNCPYKVRRFNWFSYSQYLGDEKAPTPAELYNPNVTVRTQGVMEKCTYCVQRITSARITANNSGNKIPDGGVVTACQQVCPTQAIAFGDIKNPSTQVSRSKNSPRNYALLGELGTRPRTSYLMRIINDQAGPPA